MALSLEKKTEIVRLQLEKLQVPDNIIMQVKSCIDISGSIQPLFNNGTIQEVVDRLLAVAVRFDNNQTLESYAFGSGAVRLSDITPNQFGSYINKTFLPEARSSGYLWSGTSYSTALSMIRKDMAGDSTPKSKGLFGGLFGKKTEESAPVNLPTYLMFITDGETGGDESTTEEIVKNLASKKIYIQFIGVGRANFRFIDRLGDDYDHVGFVSFPNVSTLSDQDMYKHLLTQELADWIKKQ